MKQVLIPKQELSLKGSFNKARSESLKILSLNNDELKVYLQEQCNQIPYLHIDHLDIDSDAFLAYDYSKRSLHDEIINQLHLLNCTYDEDVVEFLLSQLDSNGYFTCNCNELSKRSKYPSTTIQYHLNILHTLDPIGCFAFDLKDCIRIQCVASDQVESDTALLLCAYLEDIALKRFDNIIQKTNITYEEIEEGIRFIQSCNPKPAANYATDVMYVNPEFKIEVQQDTISIQLLQDDLHIEFEANEDNANKELTEFMKEQRKQVQHMISNLQKRNMTLLQIMQYICDVQKDYFLYHKPVVHLTLAMISENCGLHISTISRAIMNKSFEFEQRYIPLKKMLTHGGIEGTSQEEIKKRIIAFIEEEDKHHPYSDETLRTLLEKEGIKISRRAIAKYRESCFIFNASKRKLL